MPCHQTACAMREAGSCLYTVGRQQPTRQASRGLLRDTNDRPFRSDANDAGGMRAMTIRHNAAATSPGVPVAPHIAAALADFGGTSLAVAELRRSLTPGQLAGLERLPDPLPAGPRVRTAANLALLNEAERRLLLVAALAVVDSAEVLISAAGVEIETVILRGGAAHLSIERGRFRFIDQRVRALVHLDATAEEHADAHRSLAHTLRALGYPLFAAWHASVADPRRVAESAGSLLKLGNRLLAKGDARSAAHVGSFVTRNASGSQRLRGSLLAGVGALWAGQFDDAIAAFRYILDQHSSELHRTAASHIAVIDQLRAGPVEGPDIKTRAILQTEILIPIAATRVDRDALEKMVEICWAIQQGRYGEGDAMQAKLYLGKLPSPPSWPWTTEAGALTPFAESHLCHLQVAFQLQAGDAVGAALTMAESLDRLPLALASGGLASSFVRLLTSASGRLTTGAEHALDALAPRRQLTYHLSDYATGSRAAAVSHSFASRREAGLEALRKMLTPREYEVVTLLRDGLSNRDIASNLELSIRTVEVHLAHILRKTQSSSRSILISRMLRAQ